MEKKAKKSNESQIKVLKWKNAKEWGEIQCPMFDGEYVMTYYPEGVPCYYSYTAPFVDYDGSVNYYRFDHEEGWWDENILFCIEDYYKEGMKFSL